MPAKRKQPLRLHLFYGDLHRMPLVFLLCLGHIRVHLCGDDFSTHHFSRCEGIIEFHPEARCELRGISHRTPNSPQRRMKKNLLLYPVSAHRQPPGCILSAACRICNLQVAHQTPEVQAPLFSARWQSPAWSVAAAQRETLQPRWTSLCYARIRETLTVSVNHTGASIDTFFSALPISNFYSRCVGDPYISRSKRAAHCRQRVGHDG